MVFFYVDYVDFVCNRNVLHFYVCLAFSMPISL